MNLETLRDEMNNASPEETIGLCRQTAWKIDSFNENRISGGISLAEPALLVLQTPFDPGWRASVDGMAAQAMEVDCGLLGVPLPPGEHRVEMDYVRPYRLLGSVISLSSL